MILRRFYDDPLAQASYLVGCQATGEAIVIDPNRDVEPYVRAAEADGVRIVAVTETHIHADFVSGARDLAERTGATLYLSDAGPPEWRYAFRHEPHVVLLKGGEQLRIGNIIVQPEHTPGHTPEHLSFFVTDGAASAEPIGVATGDFVFVGDVGRPDLLEKAARVADASESSARELYRSLTRFKALPDHLQVWPGHGAGSACGKGIGAVPQSTVGYEKRTNWAFAIDDEDTFVRQVLLGQPEPPGYFGIMKRINREGPHRLAEFPVPPLLLESRLPELLTAGAIVVDTRPTAAFANGHVPGTLNIPLARSFATNAGSLLPYDQDLYFIVAGGPTAVQALVRQAVLIGLEGIAGWLSAEVLDHWAHAHGGMARAGQVTASDLTSRGTNGMVVVDVRGESEFRSGRLPGARLIPLPELPGRVEEIPRDSRVVLVCATGSRSAIAASLLRTRGVANVANLVGGMTAWEAAGLEVER